MKQIRRVAKRVLAVLLAALVVIQFVPVDRSNPPVETEIPAPPEVSGILERACFDCHSNETVWPWYSRIAPVSWLVARDVHEARGEMNFSTWNQYDAKKQAKKVHEIWEEVEEGKMPLPVYLPLHPDARLSEADRAALRVWSESAGDSD